MGFKGRMQGDPDEWYYNAAWGVLRCNWDFVKLSKLWPRDFTKKTLEALEVIRTNRPEYRKVFIKGVDDAVAAPTNEDKQESKA